MSRPTVSVVFPIYLPTDAHKRMTDKNLTIAKSNTSYPAEWVIVETGSSHYLEEADIYINEKKRSKSVTSHNRAFDCCSGDYVAYLANDVTVCKDWLEKMVECFESKEDCGIASLGNTEHNDPIEEKIVEGFYFSVGMMRKEDAWYTTEYNSNFLDTDLAFRVRIKGKKFYKNLSGHVVHKPHTTVGKFSGNFEDYERCRNHFLEKYKDYADDEWYKAFGGVQCSIR